MSQFVKLTNQQIDKSATFSSFRCKIDKYRRVQKEYTINTGRIQTYRRNTIIKSATKTAKLCEFCNPPPSSHQQIDKLTNRQIDKSTN